MLLYETITFKNSFTENTLIPINEYSVYSKCSYIFAYNFTGNLKNMYVHQKV